MPLSIVQEQDGRIAVSSPYHPKFPARARSLGGIWDAKRRIWVFDAADHDRVRSLCREVYGTDGLGKEEDAFISFPEASGQGSLEFAEAVEDVPHYYGHRRRLRQRLVDAGVESLPDYELLEVLLFAANPQGDVKPTAKSLLAILAASAK